ncbi:exo-alpha-sialidase [Paenibacillus yanchengensis]|uniref:Exo-alpha-sialidase n=1 Tax=Paenibacillus yanchengensis TaxID=2035833 RepID=A0ABW4YJ83_9BACL
MITIVDKQKQFLFEDERPFQECHASTVVALPNGDLLVSYFAGSKEGRPDVAIWCSRRVDGVWQAPEKVADEEAVIHWNPVLFRKQSGEIVLHYKVGHPIATWSTRVIVSQDDGHTWSSPKELVVGDRGGRGPVKNKLVALHDGTWAAPASIENEQWTSFADLSYDEGETWVQSDMVPVWRGPISETPAGASYLPGKGIIQPTIWESKPGHVHMLMRSTGSSIYRTDSTDGGRTWSMAYRTYLPNNNSGIDLVKLENGALVLAYNPVGMSKGPRMPMLLSISYDNGHHWEELIVLDGEYSVYKKPHGTGEYSYPAIIAENDYIYVTYTWKRQRVVCWSLKIE